MTIRYHRIIIKTLLRQRLSKETVRNSVKGGSVYDRGVSDKLQHVNEPPLHHGAANNIKQPVMHVVKKLGRRAEHMGLRQVSRTITMRYLRIHPALRRGQYVARHRAKAGVATKRRPASLPAHPRTTTPCQNPTPSTLGL